MPAGPKLTDAELEGLIVSFRRELEGTEVSEPTEGVVMDPLGLEEFEQPEVTLEEVVEELTEEDIEALPEVAAAQPEVDELLEPGVEFGEVELELEPIAAQQDALVDLVGRIFDRYRPYGTEPRDMEAKKEDLSNAELRDGENA